MGSSISRLMGACGSCTSASSGPTPNALPGTPFDASAVSLASLSLYINHTPPQRPYLDEFTLFSKLPVELRLMVWELVIPGERVVRIEEFSEIARRVNVSASRCIGSKASIPTLLHVNNETRHLALKSYTLTLKNGLHKPTYFNPDIDILFFANLDVFVKFANRVISPSFSGSGDDHIEEKVKYIAIGRRNLLPFHQVTRDSPWEEIQGLRVLYPLSEFGNLRKIFIEGIYFEDTGAIPRPPPFADLVFKHSLKMCWKFRSQDGGLPELVVVGATKMKQLRFRAREARLQSWGKLTEHRP